jgi:hypothetical protein
MANVSTSANVIDRPRLNATAQRPVKAFITPVYAGFFV